MYVVLYPNCFQTFRVMIQVAQQCGNSSSSSKIFLVIVIEYCNFIEDRSALFPKSPSFEPLPLDSSYVTVSILDSLCCTPTNKNQASQCIMNEKVADKAAAADIGLLIAVVVNVQHLSYN